MKTFVLISLYIFFLQTSCSSQTITKIYNCDLYNSISYGEKNIDTLTIRVLFADAGTYDKKTDENMSKLIREGKLDKKNIGFGVYFNPIGCSDNNIYGGVYNNGMDMYDKLTTGGGELLGKPLILTCIFYKGYTDIKGHPFFIINKIAVE